MSRVRIYFPADKLSNLLRIEEVGIIHKLRNVLRLERNSPVYIFDGEGHEYLYRIESFTKKAVLAVRKRTTRYAAPPAKKVFLAFPMVREAKADLILQKATELGVSGFFPFVSSRSFKIKTGINKLERWRKVIIEACRQSERLWVPFINPVLDFKGLLSLEYPAKFVALLYGEPIDKVWNKKTKQVLVAVGPEGGFSGVEAEKLSANGFKFIKLTPNVLRTETAAVFAGGLLNVYLELNSES